jgi:hypothetical protein
VSHPHKTTRINILVDFALAGIVVIMLAIGPKVRGFKPGRGRRIFKGDESPSHDLLRRGSKVVGPHIAGFYGMLKNPADYERDISS